MILIIETHNILDSGHIPAERRASCIRNKNRAKVEDQSSQKDVFRETKFGNDKSQPINLGVWPGVGVSIYKKDKFPDKF